MSDRQTVLSRDLVQASQTVHEPESWASVAARAAHSMYHTAKAIVENPYVDGAATLVALVAGSKLLTREKQISTAVEATSLNCAEGPVFAIKGIEDETTRVIRRLKPDPVEEFSFQMPPRELPVQHDPFASERNARPLIAATGAADAKQYRPLTLTHQGHELELLLPKSGMPIIRQKPFGA